jgi:NitT/TauT family transport system permease protein
MLRRILRALLPNRAADPVTASVFVAVWASLALLVWARSPFASLPSLSEIWSALGSLWWQHGMGPELLSTARLIGHALVLTTIISLGLAYLTVMAAFRPLVSGISKLRFLGFTGLLFPFTLMTGGGYALKVALLTFGMTTFFVTSMAQVVLEIPTVELDYMRVLGANELRIVWEVVVRGTLDKALEILRQIAAMGWAMITMVEGLSRAEGGVGAMMLNENKHFRLAEVYAILLVILVCGLLMDYAMGVITNLLCPHVALVRARR